VLLPWCWAAAFCWGVEKTPTINLWGVALAAGRPPQCAPMCRLKKKNQKQFCFFFGKKNTNNQTVRRGIALRHACCDTIDVFGCRCPCPVSTCEACICIEEKNSKTVIINRCRTKEKNENHPGLWRWCPVDAPAPFFSGKKSSINLWGFASAPQIIILGSKKEKFDLGSKVDAPCWPWFLWGDNNNQPVRHCIGAAKNGPGLQKKIAEDDCLLQSWHLLLLDMDAPLLVYFRIFFVIQFFLYFLHFLPPPQFIFVFLITTMPGLLLVDVNAFYIFYCIFNHYAQ